MKKLDIRDLEIESFLRCWYKNTNETLRYFDSTSERFEDIKNMDLRDIYRDLLVAFNANKNHRIVGCDKMDKFVINLSSKEDVLKVAQEIWDNPQKFYELDGKDSYYDFIKYLWIESYEFKEETRLTDIVKTSL